MRYPRVADNTEGVCVLGGIYISSTYRGAGGGSGVSKELRTFALELLPLP